MLNYEEWLKLSEDEKMNLTDEEMPQIPKEMLSNHLTAAKAEKNDGVIGWTVTQEIRNGSRTQWFPEFKQQKVNGIPMWYRFNPMVGTYSLQIEAEPSMEEEPMLMSSPPRLPQERSPHRTVLSLRQTDG